MPAPSLPASKYDYIARLFDLINTISEEQLLIILKQLLKDKLSTHIFKLVIDLPDEQQDPSWAVRNLHIPLEEEWK